MMRILPVALILVSGAVLADEVNQFEFRRPYPLPTPCVYKTAGKTVDLHGAKVISFAALRKEGGKVVTRVTYTSFDIRQPQVVVTVPDVDVELARIQNALKACK